MAKNGTPGDGHRNGTVKERSQTYNPTTEQWVKRDANTGRFMDVKQDGNPFKGVLKEK
ncbi:hypothetical protein [Flavobacterium marginilacus]|uniref:hypothetical protein n=1 Tax=Flavobacterium marginilacus TaxID=3003256 RepID=UPI00248EB967|nr:hypothetical protein [Flavobacterium marginilacus]